MTRLLAAVALVLLIASVAYGTDYHCKVNGNDLLDGLTVATAWRTPQHAAAVMVPGDRCLFEDGQYISTTTVEPPTNGTSTARITFQAVGRRCYWSNAIDLPEASFVPATGHSSQTYRLYPLSSYLGGLTWAATWTLYQTHYGSIHVQDNDSPTNYVNFYIRDTDGPMIMATESGLTAAGVDTIDGSETVVADTLFVNRHGTGGPVPNDSLFFGHNQAVFNCAKDWIVLNGIKGRYGDTGTVMFQFTNTAAHDSLVDCHLPGSLFVDGDSITCVRDSTCHVLVRESDGSWRWDHSGSGTGLILNDSSHSRLLGCRSWHCWKTMATNDDDSTYVDNLILHGAVDHLWLLDRCHGDTIRNMVQYNGQDGVYLSACQNLLFEHVTSFTNIAAEDTLSRAIRARNCIFSKLSVDGGAIVTTVAFHGTMAESVFTLDHCLFANAGTGGVIRHTEDGGLYSLADYATYQAAHPSEHYATITSCLEVDGPDACDVIFASGMWHPDTDEWNFQIATTGSPAYNAGTPTTTMLDIGGNRRPYNLNWDIGAWELTFTTDKIKKAKRWRIWEGWR